MAQPPPSPPEPVIVAAPVPLQVKVRPAWPANYSQAKRKQPTIIVIHATDGHEGIAQDDNVAAMFARAFVPPEKPRSAHYVVDTDSVTRCVPDLLTAWHCGHTGNARGIGIELCGSAGQTREEWLDSLSLPMLQLAARLCADLCKTHGILPAVVNDRGLLGNQTGITTHAFVTKAWAETTHSDPGPGFPLAAFVSCVARSMANA